jgi:hypothetical protein
LLAAATLLVLTSCESQNTAPTAANSGVVAARDKLVADLKQCTQKHGYNPQATGMPENALAPNELPWRQCAYDAVRSYEQGHPAVSSLYDQLIAEDIQMTTAVQQGSMTRSQRRARIEELVAQIKEAEDAQISQATAEQARQQEQLRNIVDGARGFSY